MPYGQIPGGSTSLYIHIEEVILYKCGDGEVDARILQCLDILRQVFLD